jgi:hypothetical protein
MAGAVVLPADRAVQVHLAGALSLFRTAAVFREGLIQQLTMRGYRPDAVSVDTLGVLEHLTSANLSTRDYRASLTIRPYASTLAQTVIGDVQSAAEGAGSYTPTVTIPSLGHVDQPPIVTDGDTWLGAIVGGVSRGVGAAAEGIGRLPGEVPRTAMLLIVGIVVLVGFVAFSPLGAGVARRI